MPPTMAQVVSRSPRPETVSHSAASKSVGCWATHQSANGTVSSDRMRLPDPKALTAKSTEQPLGRARAL